MLPTKTGYGKLMKEDFSQRWKLKKGRFSGFGETRKEKKKHSKKKKIEGKVYVCETGLRFSS